MMLKCQEHQERGPCCLPPNNDLKLLPYLGNHDQLQYNMMLVASESHCHYGAIIKDHLTAEDRIIKIMSLNRFSKRFHCRVNLLEVINSRSTTLKS